MTGLDPHDLAHHRHRGGAGRSARPRRTHTVAWAVAVASLAALALLAGCGRVPSVTGGSTESGDTTGRPTASPDGRTEDSSFTFDDIASYEGGVEVEISGIVARQASPGVTGAEQTGGQIVVASVLIRNDSAADLDATTALVTATYGPSDTEAPLVTDPTGTLAHAFLGSVTPGAEVAADFGFAIPFSALSAVTITVDLGDDKHEPVSFTGAVERDG